MRNAVNYRPGYGYREITKLGQIDIGRDLRQNTPANVDQLLDKLEREAITIKASSKPSEDPRSFGRMLWMFGVLTTAIAETLHGEILERQGGDKRWHTLRTRFFEEKCKSSTGTLWPFSE